MNNLRNEENNEVNQSNDHDTKDYILETCQAARNLDLGSQSSSIEFPPMEMSSNAMLHDQEVGMRSN